MNDVVGVAVGIIVVNVVTLDVAEYWKFGVVADMFLVGVLDVDGADADAFGVQY